jgi:hypothetical protein
MKGLNMPDLKAVKKLQALTLNLEAKTIDYQFSISIVEGNRVTQQPPERGSCGSRAGFNALMSNAGASSMSNAGALGDFLGWPE